MDVCNVCSDPIAILLLTISTLTNFIGAKMNFSKLLKELLTITYKHNSKSKKLFLELKLYLENNINDPDLILFVEDLISKSAAWSNEMRAKYKSKQDNKNKNSLVKVIYKYGNLYDQSYSMGEHGWRATCDLCKQKITEFNGFVVSDNGKNKRYHSSCVPEDFEKEFDQARSKVLENLIDKT
jgi:hypothetical protein